ncbi:hypothetical protein Cs7R123_64060 [Catellatospora sp. TT07R-123]|uniref:RNaseH domain-containing protein n=1 Tax=Catellatospora sp. TT07R-123 TaxID=2733863 RepID=UPI001B285949|nr:RNaseH domain-containing protein [Catellatospora sp. TT07R-123]GHJ49064.1 hypothetical protein Cs7R123_64060 [Catellatospora sp. TT07R-123]
MAEQKNRRRLDVLGYRCTPELLGDSTVYLRQFPDAVKSLWTLLERRYRDRMGREEVQAPYTIATTALRCLTGGYAFFDPERLFLVSGRSIDDDTLCDAFTLMHGLAAGLEIDDIHLGSPVALAERIAGTPEEPRRLADYLTRTPQGQSNAEPWVYRSATWDFARQLTQRSWNVDGKEISLRPDNVGGFVAWDHPWANKSGTAFAIARGRIAMKTMPNLADPVFLLSASSTRVKSGMFFARTVLAETDAKGPVIEVEMVGRSHIRNISRMALQVLGRLKMDNSVLHQIQAQVDREVAQAEEAKARGVKWYPPAGDLGPIRPIHSKNYKFPVGRGVGMHFLRELDKHVRSVFGDVARSPQIFFDTQGFKRVERRDGLYADPQDVTRSLTSMGYERLTLACLWYRDENRIRMLNGLAEAYGLDASTLDPAEGEPVTLVEGAVSATFHRVPGVLEHGPESGKLDDLRRIATLRPSPGTLVGVWAETDYDGNEDEVDESAELAETQNPPTPREDRPRRPDDAHDAKHRTRRSLSQLSVVSQFIKDFKPGKKPGDHPVQLAQLDLNRSLGLIDRRVDNVMIDHVGSFGPQEVAHCGIHVRRQSKRPGERSAKICITAVVLKPPASEGLAWTLHGWSYTDRRWRPYHLAQTAYHSKDYPSGKLAMHDDDNAGRKQVAVVIDQALSELHHYLGGTPYTVTVDGLATRRLWEGLHNKKQGQVGKPGTTWLPGHTLPLSERPLAVIRLNKDDDEVIRPISHTTLNSEDEILREGGTTTLLYRLEPDFGDPTWLLSTVPVQHDGSGAGRLGADKTRWTASYGSNVEGELAKNEMRANWYTMNATEIFVIPLREGVDSRALAAMTARLCHQSLAWTSRTRYSVQLHAAQQMDLDHPQYRRSAATQDPEAAPVGEAQLDDQPDGE